jgi:succinate dehydrogenase/fumarate reductase-like Fe-S protein
VVAFVEELDAWHEAAPMRTLDVTRDLKIKVEQLDKEVRALKRQKSNAAASVSTLAQIRASLQLRRVEAVVQLMKRLTDALQL